VVKLVDTFFCI